MKEKSAIKFNRNMYSQNSGKHKKLHNYLKYSIFLVFFRPLENTYLLFAVIAALASFILVEKVIPYFNNISKSDQSKDFKRTLFLKIFYLFLAFFWIFFGYFLFHNELLFPSPSFHMFRKLFFFFAGLTFFFFYLLLFFWHIRTPYVRITTDTITAFFTPFKIEKIPKNKIEKCDVALEKKRVDIILSQNIVRIKLSRVANPDTLIEVLSSL